LVCLFSLLLLATDPVPPIQPEPPAPSAPEVITIDLPPSRTLPDAVRTLIQTAIDTRDEAALAAIVKVAAKAFPDNRGAITAATAQHDSEVAAKRRSDEQARLARLSNPDPLANWSGEVELGASRATGNTDNLALYAAIKADRTGLFWRHSLRLRADLQTTSGTATTERILAAWQPNHQVDDDFYIYGLAQFERDRFLGIADRETLGGGIGYSVVQQPAMKLDVEGGPALRHTGFAGGEIGEDGGRTTIAGRASMKFRWTISPSLHVSQDVSTFLESGNNNASATTSLDTRLIGAIKARFSYNLQYEQNAPTKREPLDTLSRATLIYSF
jgi:putative salt-induced outer membrane protein